mgnify:FL=1
MAFTQEVMNYDSLLAGPTQVIATVPLAASQTVKRGDLLVAAVTIAAGASASTIAASFSKAAAAAAPGNLHMIAAEDADTTGGAGQVLAYGAGYYNEDAVGLTGDLATNKMVLLQQGIVLVHVQSGEVALPDED